MLTSMNQPQLDLGFVLKPNCLLTRRPLLFLTPPRSLFYYKSPWGLIMHILSEHGYKVDIWQLPFQNIQNQKMQILRCKSELSKKHLFMDGITYKNLKSELSEIKKSTMTVISKDTPKDTIFESQTYLFRPLDSAFSINYWLHQKWHGLFRYETPSYAETLSQCTEKSWHQLLNHCVNLAEIDFETDSNQ